MRPASLFYVFAPEDKPHLDMLEKQLSLLRREGALRCYHCGMVEVGKEWLAEMDRELSAAEIILLLVSADYLASPECFHIQTGALARHRMGTALVIPILVRPVDWCHGDMKDLQALPPDGKAVTQWTNPDEAWCSVAKGIRRVTVALRCTEP